MPDPAVEDALHDILLFRHFAWESISNETTMLRFRALLETHGIGVQMLATIYARLSGRGLWFKAGMLVVSTISAAPNSTGKGNQYHFHMTAQTMTIMALHYPKPGYAQP